MSRSRREGRSGVFSCTDRRAPPLFLPPSLPLDPAPNRTFVTFSNALGLEPLGGRLPTQPGVSPSADLGILHQIFKSPKPSLYGDVASRDSLTALLNFLPAVERFM